ncbi:MAG: hypothetical protein JSU65_06485, partial [Candidatus Zixiibacteriota bacterium]
IVDSGGPFESFEVVANGNGPVDPPQSAALGSVGFPTPGNANPGSDQQAGAGKWAFHTVDNGGSSGGGSLGSYGAFLDRTLRNDNELDVMDMEFEMRFTGSSGSWAIRAFTDGAAVWVPFELWRIGHCTPDDPSDDVRMSVWMLEHADNGVYDLENWGTSGNGGGEFEHSSSPGNDDPYTDWIYWVLPADSTPGQSGYLADEAAIRGGTYGYDGEEVMARTVLINVDGGIGPSFNQDRPEDGTVFRITGRNSIPCGCCVGMTGNVDNDTGDVTDIGDLTALIDFLFISFEPPVCMEEANADGAGDVDIGDLTRLINFLFISFDPPADCL